MASSDISRDARDTSARAKPRSRGPGAASFKYDILTALMVTAAQSYETDGRLAGRLALLITARFNWQSETFAVGQRELARLWNVTERTVKREMGAMRALGWVRVISPAARGRVARHGIDLEKLIDATARHWEAVGPDFAARMSEVTPGVMPGVSIDTDSANIETNVVPLRPAALPEPGGDAYGWSEAARRLRESQPAIYEAWYAALVPTALEGGRMYMTAPSRFVADYVSTHYRRGLLQALSTGNPDVRDVVVLPPA